MDTEPNKSFKAITLEDLKPADFVAVKPETLEVYRWNNAFGLPPVGIVLFAATKGETVEVFSRLNMDVIPVYLKAGE